MKRIEAGIVHARDGDSVIFAASLAGQTITLSSGEIVIRKASTSKGPARPRSR